MSRGAKPTTRRSPALGGRELRARVSAEEHARVQAAAEAAGVTREQFIRDAALGVARAAPVSGVRVEQAAAERDSARRDLAALRDYLTRSVADDTTVHDAWDILHNLAPEDLARVLKWVEEIDGRPKGDVHIPMDLYHRLLSAGLKDAEGVNVLEWITARVERCAELESDMRTAAGELLVPMSKPGTHMARLLSANVLMRRELAELRSLGASIHKAVAAALEARAEDLDAKADAAFTAAVKAGEAGDEEREDAESARWTAYRVAARIVRGAP